MSWNRLRPRPRRSRHRPDPEFHDWVGTIAVLENLTGGPHLEALAGFDRRSSIIVGVDIELARRGQPHDVVTFDIVDLSALDVDTSSGSFIELATIAATEGWLPITKVHVDGVSAGDLLRRITGGRISVRATGLDAEFITVKTEQRGRPRPALIAPCEPLPDHAS